MNAFESLAEYCGILTSFVDARGVTRTTTPETRRALLLAMGMEVTDETSARRKLAEIQAREAGQRLPPVHVHYQASGAVVLSVAGTSGLAVNGSTTTPIDWRIDLESGGVEQGTTMPVTPASSAIGSAPPQHHLRIDTALPAGYHTLSLAGDASSCLLIVTPGQCWLPAGLDSGRRLWGIAAQLYLLRSEANWGIGDYGDLRRLIQILAARGGDVVGLNPLHAMFVNDPEQASPYSPASRLLLNVLSIDVARLVADVDCEPVRRRVAAPSFQQALTRCREARLLDYSGVAALKLPLLKELFDCCDRDAPAWHSFLEFRAGGGESFERGCLFLALCERFSKPSAIAADWHEWPEDYRSADAPGTLRFASENPEAVTFQAWQQFVADSQLGVCSEAAADMAVGLYRDLAVGAARGGAETWANPRAVIDSAQVGAPPDIYNPQGQDWGLPPFNPRALRAEGYRSFIELLRANMRHAGGLRIDHVMALQQLYWVPQAKSPKEGAYVRYPLEDLVGILALESQRHQCLIVGEDLGTVPAGFRERMERANILSYRVLFFEQVDGQFIPPEKYPHLALGVAGSHDLPSLRAWWRGTDLALKEQLHLYPADADAARAANERAADRETLVTLMQKIGLAGEAGMDEESFVGAAHALLAQSRAGIAMLQIDDITGEVEPVNVPTTSDEYPNWRRRLSVSLERFAEDARFLAATSIMRVERARSA